MYHDAIEATFWAWLRDETSGHASLSEAYTHWFTGDGGGYDAVTDAGITASVAYERAQQGLKQAAVTHAARADHHYYPPMKAGLTTTHPLPVGDGMFLSEVAFRAGLTDHPVVPEPEPSAQPAHVRPSRLIRVPGSSRRSD